MCKEFGGYVVEIETQEEQNFVKDFLNRAEIPAPLFYPDSDESVWLGAIHVYGGEILLEKWEHCSWT